MEKSETALFEVRDSVVGKLVRGDFVGEIALFEVRGSKNNYFAEL